MTTTVFRLWSCAHRRVWISYHLIHCYQETHNSNPGISMFFKTMIWWLRTQNITRILQKNLIAANSYHCTSVPAAARTESRWKMNTAKFDQKSMFTGPNLWEQCQPNAAQHRSVFPVLKQTDFFFFLSVAENVMSPNLYNCITICITTEIIESITCVQTRSCFHHSSMTQIVRVHIQTLHVHMIAANGQIINGHGYRFVKRPNSVLHRK